MTKYVKKTMEIDESVVKKLRKFFDVKTDKEAVNKALRLIADESEIIETHTNLAGTLDFQVPFN